MEAPTADDHDCGAFTHMGNVMIVGNTFVKFLRCWARAGGDPLAAAEMCRKDYGNDAPALSLCQRAIIASGNMGGDAAFRAALNDFLNGVRAFDVLARIDALSPLHAVPVRTRVLVENEAPVAHWIGEGQPKPVSGASFEQVTIEPAKACGLIVVTKEIVHLATDAAERALTRSLQRAVAKLTSAAAFSTAPDADAPPSLLAGATEVPATGNVQADMAALVAAFEGDIERAVLVVSSNTAMALVLAGFGGDRFGVKGGVIFGLPCVASADVPDNVVALVDSAGIAYGDDGLDLSTAEHATVTIDGAAVGLWQRNLVGFRAERFVSWEAAPGALAYLSGVNWTAAATRATKAKA
ncbi:phage major capsid protein [Paraburkholderia ferrariae]|uniref:Phage major capsid protein n=1 Tax=Paraburkholderia ferrariae TaxID=386056 RepID=A0ABU9RIF0_9BURK